MLYFTHTDNLHKRIANKGKLPVTFRNQNKIASVLERVAVVKHQLAFAGRMESDYDAINEDYFIERGPEFQRWMELFPGRYGIF